MATAAPSEARRLAMAAPIEREPPVTSATLPVSGKEEAVDAAAAVAEEEGVLVDICDHSVGVDAVDIAHAFAYD